MSEKTSHSTVPLNKQVLKQTWLSSLLNCTGFIPKFGAFLSANVCQSFSALSYTSPESTHILDVAITGMYYVESKQFRAMTKFVCRCTWMYAKRKYAEVDTEVNGACTSSTIEEGRGQCECYSRIRKLPKLSEWGCESDVNNNLLVCTNEAKPYEKECLLVSKLIKEFERILKSYFGFYVLFIRWPAPCKWIRQRRGVTTSCPTSNLFLPVDFLLSSLTILKLVLHLRGAPQKLFSVGYKDNSSSVQEVGNNVF